jgi:two-component system sensor histidine kinase/response regulator
MNEVLKVLCLEDSPRDAEIMRELLTDAGYDLNMDCTAIEKEFVSFLRNRRYDIILSDFKLPGFDGFGALRWSVEICPDIPFICVSGSIGESLAVELLKKGAVDYVLKDRLERLPSAVQRAIDVAKEKEARLQAEKEIVSLNTQLEKRVIERTAQLEDANKELEAFSYSVSHDLRAPLRSIHSYTNILLEEYESKLDDEGKRLCGIISSDAIRMSGLIDDLLNFSRIGRSSLNASLLNMRSMAGSTFAEIASENEKARTNLKIGKLNKVYGDDHLIRLVWNNLISNAIKYSSKKEISEISIGSQSSGNMISFYIKDNGVGFDMLYKHKLFGVFQRLHSGKDFEGNGVGLAIVQRIIQRHGGKVWAEGEVDKGATFFFSLPLQDIKRLTTHDSRRTVSDFRASYVLCRGS